jgi:hypothetical protein
VFQSPDTFGGHSSFAWILCISALFLGKSRAVVEEFYRISGVIGDVKAFEKQVYDRGGGYYCGSGSVCLGGWAFAGSGRSTRR